LKTNLKNATITFLGITFLLLYTFPVHGEISEPHNADAMWIEPSSIDLTTAPIGYQFNITLALNISSTYSVGVWQAKVLFNTTYLKATQAGYTNGTKSDWLKNLVTVPGEPAIDNVIGYVLVGESLVGSAVPSPGAGTLSWIGFNLTGIPSVPSILVFNITATYKTTATYIGDDVNAVFTPYDSVAVIPEFPSPVMLSMLMILALASIVFARKQIQKQNS
jgi:hypothetical protein